MKSIIDPFINDISNKETALQAHLIADLFWELSEDSFRLIKPTTIVLYSNVLSKFYW
jgi:hypothetical protein